LAQDRATKAQRQKEEFETELRKVCVCQIGSRRYIWIACSRVHSQLHRL
jgi:hypothetical protein